MPQYKIGIFQFAYQNLTHTDVTDWILKTVLEMNEDAQIGHKHVYGRQINDTPVTVSRNRALAMAEAAELDYALFIDSDMCPDLDVPGAKPFWSTSWEFMKASPEPCVIAAPYCGPPPHENIYVFRWNRLESDSPEPGFRIEQYGRFDAARMTGIQRAAGLATGLMLMDMRAIRKLPHPRFYYEYHEDSDPCQHCGCRRGPQTQRASTEDLTFTRDLGMYGVPLYCNWDAWAGHWKAKKVGKPSLFLPDGITRQMLEGAAAYGMIPPETPIRGPVDWEGKKPIPKFDHPSRAEVVKEIQDKAHAIHATDAVMVDRDGLRIPDESWAK